MADWDKIAHQFLGPLIVPRNPIAVLRFVAFALWPASTLARLLFREERMRAAFAGLAGHSSLPLDQVTTAAYSLILSATAHAVGWPMPRGGAQSLANALAAYLRSLGGEIVTGHAVENIDDLPPQRAVLFDVSPRQLDRIAGSRLPDRYRRKLRGFRYGPGVFKLDLALAKPIPWRAQECKRSITVHVGGTFEEIMASERRMWNGEHPEKPLVLLAQPSLFDPTRAPDGKHIVWAYCHVPNGSTLDMSERIIAQVERFAPGFRDRILACTSHTAMDIERCTLNCIGGDLNSGVQDWRQLYTRPMARYNPYTTPARDIFLCSSSTPPGSGVHGMCGYYAARAALSRVFKDDDPIP